MNLEQWGALSFGIVIGWFLYFVNRYRKDEASFSDITTVIGAVAGAAVTSLFSTDGALFGAYGIGLGIGFFSYFLVLIILVAKSANFDADYFLDGRRKRLPAEYEIPGGTAQPTYQFDPIDPQEQLTQAATAAAVAAATAVKAQK